MTISGVSSGSYLHAQKPMTSGSGNVAQLEQQKKALQDEIKRVKEDDKLQPDAKKKKIDALEKKMQKIEEAIQKASANETKNGQAQKASASKKIDELSDPDSSKKFLQKLDIKEQPEQMHKNKFAEVGSLLDIYA